MFFWFFCVGILHRFAGYQAAIVHDTEICTLDVVYGMWRKKNLFDLYYHRHHFKVTRISHLDLMPVPLPLRCFVFKLKKMDIFMRYYDVHYNWCVVFHFTHDYDIWDGLSVQAGEWLKQILERKRWMTEKQYDVKIIHLFSIHSVLPSNDTFLSKQNVCTRTRKIGKTFPQHAFRIFIDTEYNEYVVWAWSLAFVYAIP